MPKTFMEKKYEKAMLKSISSLGYARAEEEALVSEFYANSHTYYGLLCDALYAVSTGQDVKPIWITPTGQCYLGLFSQTKSDRILLFPDEIPMFSLDLVNQLDIAINKI